MQPKSFTISYKFLISGIFIILMSCSTDVKDESLPGESDENTTNEPITIESFINVTDFELPPQDSEGFTVIEASEESRIVYVNNVSGNDTNGTVYGINAVEIGSDIQNPTNAIRPFKTIAAAKQNMRDNEPDIMLLAAGGVWYESLSVTNGRSSVKRSIFAAYGQGDRPELRTGNQRGITTPVINNTIISGIKFWAHTRDDEGPYFESFEGNGGFKFDTRNGQSISNVLIEDCVFRTYTNNTIQVTEIPDEQPFSKFVLRRNIISKNYSNEHHSQGMFANGKSLAASASILLEGNIFEHNGWRIQRRASTDGMSAEDGQATYYNHNTYFANTRGVLFYGNIFIRPSSMGNKWTANNGENSSSDIAIVDNLYVDGEIGIGIGGNEGGPRRFSNIFISNNVMLNIGESRPTNRNLAWSIQVKDWNGGEIKENIFAHQKNSELSSVFALKFDAATAIKDVTISNNTIYGLLGSSNPTNGLLRFGGEGSVNNVNFTGNYFYNKEETPLVSFEGQEGYSFTKNYYQSTRESEWFGDGNSWIDFETWKVEVDANAEIFDINSWTDPERDVSSYMLFIGEGSTTEDFIQHLYNQSKSNWDSALTAPYINQWIRAGYNR